MLNLAKKRTTLLLAVLLFACCRGERRPEQQEPERHIGLHRLTIGKANVYVDIASTGAAREQGLMFVESLPEDEGMLFIYPDSDMRSFWMKNTLIPLSLAYIDTKGVIFQIIDMLPLDETGHPSDKPAQYVLEVNRGWFEKNGVKIGDSISNLPSPEGAQ